QWPGMNPSRLLVWSGEPDQLSNSLTPIAQWLAPEGAQLPQTTRCRSLEHLHGGWQTDLERLRRVQWRQLQQRTQWLVAAGVLLTPAMSLDLLVLSVANGLMLRDMARLWGCTWTLEQLQAAALQVGKATLALGIVEWSTQEFAAAFKLEGTTWLVGGTLQALSAAYLTRVIGHAMADLMARNVGVSEPDLEAIKAEVPLLVAKAAEAERLQWGAFLQEALSWLRQQNQGGPIQLKAP
ncbi:MAG: YcjF family protein, partial [Cyanobacteriota bacterium]